MREVTTQSRDAQLMADAVDWTTARGGFELGFGGLVDSQFAPLSAYSNTIGRSIHGLGIQAGEGLGGKVMATRSLRYTTDYRQARSITHRYEREVAAEHIVTLASAPVVVCSRVRAILYGGFRIPTQIGAKALDVLVAAAQRMSWEISVRDEVDHRVAQLVAQQRDRGDADGESPAHQDVLPSVDPHLTVRELDVIALVATGMRNAEIAQRLNLRETTVKGHVSSVMRKVGARSRLQAVLSAKAAGLIP
ncbi:response regulator transcription factor [Microbacterium sp. NPDC055357]